MSVKVGSVVNNSGRQTNVPSLTFTSLMALVWFHRWLVFLFPLTASGLSPLSGFWRSLRSIEVFFFISKPQRPRPRSHKPGLCPLPSSPPSHRHTGVHACTHTQPNTHRYKHRGRCRHANAPPPRHAHLFLMLMSLHILAGWAHLFKQLPLSSVTGCRQTKTQKQWAYFKWTKLEGAKAELLNTEK